MKLKTKLSKLRHDGHITDAEYSIIINALNKKPKERVIANVPSVTQKPSEDCISRQAVLDSLYDWSNHSMTDAETWHLRQVMGDIKSLPSVTPQSYAESENKE